MKQTMAEQMKFSSSARDLAAYWYESRAPVQLGCSSSNLHKIAYNIAGAILPLH